MMEGASRADPGPLLLAACGSAADAPPSPMPSLEPDCRDAAATASSSHGRPRDQGIPDAQWRRMQEAGVVRPGGSRVPTCAGGGQLPRLERDVQRRVLVVKRDVAEDVTIFRDIFEAEFPIRSMKPIEQFGSDDNASMAADKPRPTTVGGRAGQPATFSPPPAAAPSTSIRGRTLARSPVRRYFMPTPSMPRGPGKGQDPRGWHGVAGLHETGLDLAGHRHPGLPALRHRLSVGGVVRLDLEHSRQSLTAESD